MNIKWKLLIWVTLIFTIQAGCSPANKVFLAEPTPIAATSAVQEEAPALPTGSTPTVAESLAESTPLTATSAMQGEATTIPAQLPTQDYFPGTSSGKMPVIFIHGGGPCDIGALVYLTKHPNIDLIGMVLSFGEFHPINAMDDWPVFLYDILDYDSAALGLGSDAPLDPKGYAFPEEWRNLADDFWGLDLPAPGKVYDPAVGYELIVHLIKNSPQKVTVLIMSGQTDLALAFMNDPGIADHIANIVIMGGAFTIPGNLNEDPRRRPMRLQNGTYISIPRLPRLF